MVHSLSKKRDADVTGSKQAMKWSDCAINREQLLVASGIGAFPPRHRHSPPSSEEQVERLSCYIPCGIKHQTIGACRAELLRLREKNKN